MSLGKMTLASATTPYYFRPVQIPDTKDGNLYVSGDSIALSPAMFGMLHANEKLGQAFSDMRVVSIGSINEEPDKIETQSSLLGWAMRLSSLNAPVKKHT